MSADPRVCDVLVQEAGQKDITVAMGKNKDVAVPFMWSRLFFHNLTGHEITIEIGFVEAEVTVKATKTLIADGEWPMPLECLQSYKELHLLIKVTSPELVAPEERVFTIVNVGYAK